MAATANQTCQIRLKDKQLGQDRRMVIPSVRIKWKEGSRYVYEPNEAVTSDFMVNYWATKNIRSLHKIQHNEPVTYFEIEILKCK